MYFSKKAWKSLKNCKQKPLFLNDSPTKDENKTILNSFVKLSMKLLDLFKRRIKKYITETKSLGLLGKTRSILISTSQSI